ncbi:MAG: B-box zinc finger protein [Archangium sp.]|nr:B-box zinc finger protein [Archangium sp.]
MSAACAVHPGEPATGTCPRCGNFICRRCEFDAAGNCSACATRLGPGAIAMPWEQREQLGWARAFLEQTKLGLRSPRLYVSAIRPEARWQDAFSYGWLMAGLVALLTIPYNTFNFWQQGQQMKQSLAPLGNSAPVLIISDLYAWLGSYPLFGAAALSAFSVLAFPVMFLFTTGAQHLGLMVTGVAARKPINATMLAVGYSQAVAVLMAIPVVGGFASFYLLVVQIWALREVHRATTLQAAVATLWPTVLVGCCGAFAAIAFVVKLLSGLR